MKKTGSLVTLIFAAVTAISAIGSLVLAEKPEAIAWVMAAILALSAVGMWAIPAFAKNKMLTVIPVLALFTVTSYFAEMSAAVAPVTGSFETLGLMLTVAFVVAAVFAFKKGCKWAVVTATVYTGLTLVEQTYFFLECVTEAPALGDKASGAAIVLLALAFVTAFAAQITTFLGIEAPKAEEKEAAASDAENDASDGE